MHVMKLFDLSGKVALVTGGAGNYGRQMVEALAEAGATVWTASRSLEKNEEFASQFRKRGLDVHGAAYDQTDEASMRALLETILKKHGRIDVLVNNSVLRSAKSDYASLAECLNHNFSANATGVILMCHIFGDQMALQGGGSIINIGSYMGMLGCNDTLYEGSPQMASTGANAYFFHKGGMHNYTKYVAAKYGPKNVRCNCLSLGGLFNHQPEPFLEQYAKATFLGRMADQEDVKGAVVYLASEASKYMTGAVIPLDGGYSAK